MASTNDCYKVSMVNDILDEHLKCTTDNTCAICGYNYKKLWGEDCEDTNDYYIFWPDKHTEAHDSVMNHIHCLCNSCSMVDIDKQRERLGEPPYMDNEDN